MPSEAKARITINRLHNEQRRFVSLLDADVLQMEALGLLLSRFEAKIQRVLDRVWGNGIELSESEE